MGMGRNSSRIASRRSQQAAKENEVRSALYENGLKRESDESPDDDNDADWSCYADKRVKRLKKDKRSNSPRRYKNSKVKNGDHHAEKHERSNTPDLSMHSYEFMSIEERKSLLMATCGVISGHTKKMCTKSLRCPQHTDEQRRQVRQFLLGTSGITEDDDQIDIDTYDDGDSQSLRESLQWEAASSNSSPADSNSTTNSSGSKKRPPVKTSSSKSSSKKRKLKLDNGSSSSSSTLIASSQLSSLYDFE
ncbi:hypothetical protein ACJMK2_021702 [Sinanodonta woodiana]|uniref:SCA7 domain-containing protein n=1 Tax=Sinanodonta woodiana TaxID=1069815 RepID=A0ABD3TGV8_SINWO